MTREEITKEAQEQVNYCTPLHPEDFIHGYIAGTEPREKRIEELETENNKLLDVINNQDVKIADLEGQIEQAKEIIKALIALHYNPIVNKDDLKKQDKILEQAEQFLKGGNIILEDAQVDNSPFDADEVFNKEMKAYPEEKVK